MWVRPSDGLVNALEPICIPAWLGRPPLMLNPLGTSMTLASRRRAPLTPLPGASTSASLLLIASVWPSVPALDTTAAGATTSTVGATSATGRSKSSFVV